MSLFIWMVAGRNVTHPVSNPTVTSTIIPIMIVVYLCFISSLVIFLTKVRYIRDYIEKL